MITEGVHWHLWSSLRNNSWSLIWEKIPEVYLKATAAIKRTLCLCGSCSCCQTGRLSTGMKQPRLDFRMVTWISQEPGIYSGAWTRWCQNQSLLSLLLQHFFMGVFTFDYCHKLQEFWVKFWVERSQLDVIFLAQREMSLLSSPSFLPKNQVSWKSSPMHRHVRKKCLLDPHCSLLSEALNHTRESKWCD